MDKNRMGKRRWIQLFSAILYNANLKGFAEGKIYKGKKKGVCVPGLNCYSCPGAIGSCPLGSLQSSLTSISYKIPLYVMGMLLVFGIVFGRAICGFLCPFGLIQELLYKIPSPKVMKNKMTRYFTWVKYVVLAIFVLMIPLYTAIKSGVAVPGFCKYKCPAGTLEGGIPLVLKNSHLQELIGKLFSWKLFLLFIILLGSVFLYRFFCRFLCPLGAIYSFFNAHAILGVTVNENKCTKCNACVRFCKMDVKKINDRECIRCGDCKEVCHFDGIEMQPNIKKERKLKAYEKN